MRLAVLISNLRQRGIRLSFIRAICAIAVKLRVARSMKNFLDYAFDARNGTKTSGTILLDNLAIESKRQKLGTFYVATPKYEFRKIIRNLAIDPAKYVFVDLGCGMGKVLLFAIEHNFSGIIGIEFSSYLADVAAANVKKYAKKYGASAQVITCDAAEFRIPRAPCVLWLFNPFTEAVTREVLVNIREAYLYGNQDIYIIWYNVTPNAAPLFEANWLEVVAGVATHLVSANSAPPALQMAEFLLPYSIFKTCQSEDCCR